MKQHDNDNEKFSFITLSAATGNVTRYLGLDEQKDGASDNDRSDSNERDQKALERREFVRRRLIEIRRFEDRAAGKGRK
jgi:hypothetical protein